MYGLWRKPNVQPTAFGQALAQAELYDPTTGAVARSFAEEATVGTGTLKADIEAFRVTEADRNPESSPITEDEYKNSAELYSEGVAWYDGMTREAASIQKEFNDAAQKRAEIIRDASTGQTALGFTVGFGAGIFEPKNLVVGAAVSVAAPALGTVGWLGNTARRAYQMRKAATLGQKVAIGAGEGVVAGALVEPTNRYSAKILQQDYTMLDSVFNITTSAAFGAGVPVAARGIGKAAPFIREKIAKFKGRTMDVVTAEIDLATQQLALGQRVDVSAVEAAEIGSIAKKPIAEQAKAAQGFVRYTETPEFKKRFEGSKVVDADGKPLMVYHGTGGALKGDLFPSFTGKVGEAVYLAFKPDLASRYALNRGDNATIYPFYVASKKMADFSKGISFDEYLEADKLLPAEARGRVRELTEGGKRSDKFWIALSEYGINKPNEIARVAKALGYDSIRYDSSEIAVFDNSNLLPAFGDKQLPEIIAQVEANNTTTISKANAAAIDPRNDTLIDYDAIDAADERRAIQRVEGEAEAEAYYQEAEAEIRLMLEQDILNDADLDEYRAALESLNSRTPIDALETLKLCLTRG